MHAKRPRLKVYPLSEEVPPDEELVVLRDDVQNLMVCEVCHFTWDIMEDRGRHFHRFMSKFDPDTLSIMI